MHFRIQQVHIDGPLNFVSDQTVQTAVMPYVNHGFFNISVDSVVKDLQVLPGVASVSVRRVFPDKVWIHIQEVTPVAFNGPEEESLVDQQGNIFTPELFNHTSGLPIFVGPIDQMKAMVDFYKKIKNPMQTAGLQIKEINLDALGQWEVLTLNGLEIDCGQQDALSRLTDFLTAYPSVLAQHKAEMQMQVKTKKKYHSHRGVDTASDLALLKKADLRYDNGFALQWNNTDG